MDNSDNPANPPSSSASPSVGANAPSSSPYVQGEEIHEHAGVQSPSSHMETDVPPSSSERPKIDNYDTTANPPSSSRSPSSGANVPSSSYRVQGEEIPEQACVQPPSSNVQSEVAASSSDRPKVQTKKVAKRHRAPVFEDDEFVVTVKSGGNWKLGNACRSPRMKKVLFNDDNILVEKKLMVEEGKAEKGLKRKQSEVVVKDRGKGGSDTLLRKSKGKKLVDVKEDEED